MKPLQIALLGRGRWGQKIEGFLQRSPVSNLLAICDGDPGRLPMTFVGLRTDQPMEIWDSPQIEAVWIATPPLTHPGLVKSALDAGKHVLCEKPLAFTARDCRELREVAKKNHRTLLVNCTPAYLDEIERAKDEMDWTQVRRITTWRTSGVLPAHDVSAEWDLLPHDLAVLHFWLNSFPEVWSMEAHSKAYVSISATFHSGLCLELHAGYSREARREIRVFTATDSILFRQRQTAPEPLARVLAEFVNSVRSGRQPRTNAEQAEAISRVLTQVSERSQGPLGANPGTSTF